MTDYLDIVSSNIYETSPRIPKYFYPEKYNVSFYFDFLNLKYKVKEEILINTLKDNQNYLMLNMTNLFYTIKSFSLFKFDNIADEWIDFLSEKISQIENKDSINYAQIFDYPYDSKLPNVEQCIYIPLLSTIYKDEKLKVVIELEGNLHCIKKNEGMYLCNNSIEFSHIFQSDENLINYYNTNYKGKKLDKDQLVSDKFLKNLILTFTSCPSNLRNIFPCFDEPYYKSVYAFTLELDKFYVDAFPELKCISNGSLVKVSEDENKSKYIFSFSDSPYMSSYLFTITIGNYDFIETVNKAGIKLRVFTPLGNHHDGTLCMHIAEYALKFYENFFEIPYPYNKLDFVPISDMNYRALENYGCIVFKNYAMLFGHFQPFSEKKLIMRTICHEISHMWFGNLVTMDWWDDIWLNEGFARCFEFLCFKSIEVSDYIIDEQFIYQIYNRAMEYDEGYNTHSVCRKIRFVEEAETIFDTISYGKGSSLVMMLYNYIGKEFFRKSIKKYLSENKNKNTSTDMLWKCFDEITGLDISTLMKEWTNIPCHPLIIVKVIKKEDGKYYFLIEQKSLNKNDPSSLWNIPIFIKSKNFEIRRLMKTSTYEISFEEICLNYEDLVNGTNFIVFNNDLKGFYRVKYSDELFEGILKYWKNQNIKIKKNNKNAPQIYYIKYSKENIKKESIEKVSEDSENMLSDYDIYGLLSEEIREIENDKKATKKLYEILDKIKPIESLILIKYVQFLYLKFYPKNVYFDGLEKYLALEEEGKKSLLKEKEKYNLFFYSLIDHKNKQKVIDLQNKFYIDDTNKELYNNQFNDEYDAFFLYFYAVIGDNEECAKKLIIPKFIECYEFLNKNYKCVLIQIMMKYSYLINEDQQLAFFKKVLKDYSEQYFTVGYYVLVDLEKSIFHLETCSDKVIEYIIDELLFKQTRHNEINTRYLLDGKGNLFRLFKGLCDKIINEYNQKNSLGVSFYDYFDLFASDNKYFSKLESIIGNFNAKGENSANKAKIIREALINILSDKFMLTIEEATNIYERLA